MKVADIMCQNVRSCGTETNLAAAATLMWDGDCGVIPVVGEGNKVLGMITDRDICIAVATRNRRADEIRVGEVMARKIISCSQEDDVHAALDTMKEHKIRRLAVVGEAGDLKGVLSLNDIVLEAKEGKGRKSLSYGEVLEAFKSICGHRRIAVAA